MVRKERGNPIIREQRGIKGLQGVNDLSKDCPTL